MTTRKQLLQTQLLSHFTLRLSQSSLSLCLSKEGNDRKAAGKVLSRIALEILWRTTFQTQLQAADPVCQGISGQTGCRLAMTLCYTCCLSLLTRVANAAYSSELDE